MKFKKVTAMLLSVLLLAATITACGSSGEKTVKQGNKSLNLWIDSNDKTTFSAVLKKYEKENPDVAFEVNAVSTTDFQTFRKKMNAEIMGGEGPDVLLIGFNYFDDIYKLMKAGTFAAMNEFIEADKEFNRSDYNENVLNAGVFNEKQYVMPLAYRFPVLLTTQEILDDTGFDPAACADYMGFAQQMDALYEKYPERKIFPNAGVFGNFPNVMGTPLFDYEKKEVLVDTPEMKQACEYYKRMYEQDNDTTRIFSETKAIVIPIIEKNASLFLSYGVNQFFQVASALKTKSTPIMLPLYGMDGKTGAICEFSMAIRGNSENQQNAYNLIKLFLSEEAQQNISGYNMPVRKSTLHNSIVNNYNRYQSGSDDTMILSDPGQEFADQYEKLASEPGRCDFISLTVVTEFVNRKMLPFFKGEKSYEDCMKDFIDYAEIYLSE